MSSPTQIFNGYLAPEYALKWNLLDKSDVYSFGVVVLEVISSRKHTSIILEEEGAYLHEWVTLSIQIIYIFTIQCNIL